MEPVARAQVLAGRTLLVKTWPVGQASPSRPCATREGEKRSETAAAGKVVRARRKRRHRICRWMNLWWPRGTSGKKRAECDPDLVRDEDWDQLVSPKVMDGMPVFAAARVPIETVLSSVVIYAEAKSVSSKVAAEKWSRAREVALVPTKLARRAASSA